MLLIEVEFSIILFYFSISVTQRDHIKKLRCDFVIKQEELNRITAEQSTLSCYKSKRRERERERKSGKNEGIIQLFYISRQETEHQLSKLCSVIRSSSTLSPKQSAQDHSHSVSSSSSQQLV